MTAAQDLADVLGEVADHHDQGCPHRKVWACLADVAGRDNAGVDTQPAPEVTR